MLSQKIIRILKIKPSWYWHMIPKIWCLSRFSMHLFFFPIWKLQSLKKANKKINNKWWFSLSYFIIIWISCIWILFFILEFYSRCFFFLKHGNFWTWRFKISKFKVSNQQILSPCMWNCILWKIVKGPGGIFRSFFLFFFFFFFFFCVSRLR